MFFIFQFSFLFQCSGTLINKIEPEPRKCLLLSWSIRVSYFTQRHRDWYNPAGVKAHQTAPFVLPFIDL